jgi:RHS repeat-associated protein
VADQHDTATLAIGPDLTVGSATWRQFTPYGASRGPAVTWIDNRGFLNKPGDPSTGLTDIGARWYDPTTGTFQSLDPVFEAASPQQHNGYSYAAANPVTSSNPTGTCAAMGDAICPNSTPQETKLAAQRMDHYTQANLNSLITNTVNYTLNQCSDDPRCMLRRIHAFNTHPDYLTQQVQAYQGNQLYEAAATYQKHQEQLQENSGGCGFLGLSCVGRFAAHHWRGIAQVATFALCLTPGVLLCLGAMVADTLATSAADGIQQGSWDVFGKEALIGGAVDLASAGLGFGVGKLVDLGIAKFGLETAERSSTRGVIGEVFGAYAPEYGARHAAGLGRHEAPMFHLDPIPTLVQVGSSAGLNELTCTALAWAIVRRER